MIFMSFSLFITSPIIYFPFLPFFLSYTDLLLAYPTWGKSAKLFIFGAGLVCSFRFSPACINAMSSMSCPLLTAVVDAVDWSLLTAVTS